MAKSAESTQAPAQIDNMLVSKRWMSSVKSCKTGWDYAFRCWGYRWDHGMLKLSFRERVHAPIISTKKPDFSSLKQEKVRTEFENMIKKTLMEKEINSKEERLTRLKGAMTIAIDSLPRIPKKKGKVPRTTDETEAIFTERTRELQSMLGKGTKRNSVEWRARRKHHQNLIFKTCRQDFRKYVERILTDIERAHEKGDYKAVFDGVNRLTGKSGYNGRAPTKDKDGILFKNPEELAAAWKEFAQNKFAKTEAEKTRGEMPDLGSPSQREEDVPSDEDLDFCLNALANAKAVGEDGIPIEAYRASESARNDLFQLIRDIWREEDVPAQLTRGVFCPFFKNKGSSEDMSKYRFICLLNHAYKMLSALVLRKMMKAMENFLPETQAGFRAKRGT